MVASTDKGTLIYDDERDMDHFIPGGERDLHPPRMSCRCTPKIDWVTRRINHKAMRVNNVVS